LAARWEPIVMAGLGAAAAAIDPSLPMDLLVLAVVKAGIGAAVGAYFGNHVSARREKKSATKKP